MQGVEIRADDDTPQTVEIHGPQDVQTLCRSLASASLDSIGGERSEAYLVLTPSHGRYVQAALNSESSRLEVASDQWVSELAGENGDPPLDEVRMEQLQELGFRPPWANDDRRIGVGQLAFGGSNWIRDAPADWARLGELLSDVIQTIGLVVPGSLEVQAWVSHQLVADDVDLGSDRAFHDHVPRPTPSAWSLGHHIDRASAALLDQAEKACSEAGVWGRRNARWAFLGPDPYQVLLLSRPPSDSVDAIAVRLDSWPFPASLSEAMRDADGQDRPDWWQRLSVPVLTVVTSDRSIAVVDGTRLSLREEGESSAGRRPSRPSLGHALASRCQDDALLCLSRLLLTGSTRPQGERYRVEPNMGLLIGRLWANLAVKALSESEEPVDESWVDANDPRTAWGMADLLEEIPHDTIALPVGATEPDGAVVPPSDPIDPQADGEATANRTDLSDDYGAESEEAEDERGWRSERVSASRWSGVVESIDERDESERSGVWGRQVPPWLIGIYAGPDFFGLISAAVGEQLDGHLAEAVVEATTAPTAEALRNLGVHHGRVAKRLASRVLDVGWRERSRSASSRLELPSPSDFGDEFHALWVRRSVEDLLHSQPQFICWFLYQLASSPGLGASSMCEILKVYGENGVQDDVVLRCLGRAMVSSLETEPLDAWELAVRGLPAGETRTNTVVEVARKVKRTRPGATCFFGCLHRLARECCEDWLAHALAGAYGSSLKRDGDVAGAELVWQTAFDAGSDDRATIDGLSAARLRRGDRLGAKEVLEMGLARLPTRESRKQLESRLKGLMAKASVSEGLGPGPAPEEVRQWARRKGLKVGQRGRIPGEIRDAWNRANPARAMD